MTPAAINSAISPTSVQPVAIAHTPFAEKFAIPRQPQLATAARAVIELLPPYNQPEALVGLEQVSHIWLLFQFHQAPADDPAAPRLRVRPPRLGGNEKLGVFATRSTHRPNGIGQSVVKLEKVEGTRLWVSGVDLLDGTPILDIKPYVPYADSISAAHNGIASEAPATVSVRWQAEARTAAQLQGQRLGEDVVALVEQCLAQDPKPAYQQPDPERRYGVRFWDLNVVWHYPQSGGICVLAVDVDGAE